MTLPAGARLGPYEILSPLGAGGMGEVYRARDARLGREVAIKVLPEELSADTGRLRRFEKEAQSASALNHPNIVTIYDIGRENSLSYIAMEFVDGRTLRELLAGGALPIRKLLGIAAQVADGLAKAHSAGIVHRDLKPENVMVTTDGLVKILDFGLAKLAHPEIETGQPTQAPTVSEGTRPGIVMGTVSYMSPEQASGHPVDFRSDQFSFGSILYEMATAKRAFSRPTAAQTMAAIIQDEPEPIANLNPSIPAPLRWIAERCLAKEPRERYASTEDLARDLSTLRGHLSEASSSGAALAIEARPGRLRLAPILALLLLLGVLAGTFYLGERVAEKPFPSFQRLTFRRGGVSSARFAPDGRTVVYGAAWDGDPIRLFSMRTEGRESSRFELPDADVASVSSTGEAAILLERPFNPNPWPGGTLARVPLGGGAPREIATDVLAADWSPDGKTLAVARRVGPRFRIEYPVGKVLHETNDRVMALRVSPNGNRIAFVAKRALTDHSVELLDLAGTRKTLTQGWRWAGQGLAWSPDEKEVWFSANEGGWVNPIRAVTLSGRVRVVLHLPTWLHVLDIFPDRRVLLTMGSARTRMFGRTPGEGQDRDLSWHEGSQVVDITLDGKTVFFMEPGEGSPAGNTAYVRGTNGSPAKRIGIGVPIAISPDGRFAAMIEPGRSSHLMLVPTGVGESRVLDGGDKEYVNGGWFPDGKQVLVQARTPGQPVRNYSQDVGGGPLVPIGPEGISCGAVSPDGKEAICVGRDGAAALYPIDGGSPKPVRGLQPEDEPIQLSEDGRFLFILRLEGIRAKVFRHSLETGTEELWREFLPPDRAGLVGNIGIVMSPDGRAYAYSYFYNPSDLYLVSGLR